MDIDLIGRQQHQQQQKCQNNNNNNKNSKNRGGKSHNPVSSFNRTCIRSV